MSNFIEREPFSPRAQWSDDPASRYVRECYAHLGTVAGEAMSPRELTDDALAEAVAGMRAQLARIVAQNKADRAAALAEAKEADEAFAAAVAAARAALAPYVDVQVHGGEIGDAEPALSLAQRADNLLVQAQAQHERETAKPVFVGATTQSLDVALRHCRAEQKRRADRQRATDEAMAASLRRLGIQVEV